MWVIYEECCLFRSVRQDLVMYPSLKPPVLFKTDSISKQCFYLSLPIAEIQRCETLAPEQDFCSLMLFG